MKNLHIKLLKDLISFKSITPKDDGAIDYCAKFLEDLGFKCQRLQFGDVSNLYAKLGSFEKNICFAGHIDVVPPLGGWNFDPFVLTEDSGKLYGRGTNDMKGPLASCFTAIHDFLENNNPNFSISILLTSDEEIMGDNGTKAVVDFLKKNNERIDCCILCESCSPDFSGEYIKIGCKGSLNIDLTSSGVQSHVVSAKRYGNHIHDFIKVLDKLASIKLDRGNKDFDPSNLEITSIDIENTVRNIVPNKARAKANIRFNNEWTFERLEEFILKQLPDNVEASFERFGETFIGSSEKFIKFLEASITETIGKKPGIGTSGGNSDAVFLKEITDVVEIGSPIANAHIVNEHILIDDLEKLRKLYLDVILNFEDYI